MSHTSVGLGTTVIALGLGLLILASPIAHGQTYDRILWMKGGHKAPVTATISSPDGRTLVTGSLDGKVKFWDVERQRVLRSIPLPSGVTALCFTADGTELLVGTNDGSLHHVDPTRDRIIRTFRAHEGPLLSIAVARDTTLMVTSGGDGVARLWEVTDDAPKGILTGHTAAVNCVDITADGRTVASASDDFSVKIWDVATLSVVRTHVEMQRRVYSVRFHPDGLSYATAATSQLMEQSVGLFRTSDGGLIRYVNPGTWQAIRSIAFSPDGRYIVSAAEDRDNIAPRGPTLILSDLTRPGTRIGFLLESATYPLAVTFLGNSMTIAWGNLTPEVHAAHFTDSALGAAFNVHSFSDDVTSVAWSADAATVATGCLDGSVILWNATTGDRLRSFRHAEGVRGVAFTPDGRQIASASDDGSVKVWRLDTADPAPVTLVVSSEWIASSVSCSPIGHRIAAGIGGFDSTVIVWDEFDTDRRTLLHAHASAVNTVAYTSDGRYLISGGDDGMVHIWETSSSTPVTSIPVDPKGVTWVEISPDGSALAAGGRSGSITLWDIPSGDPLLRLDGHDQPVTSIRFLPGRRLMSAAMDSTIRFWDIDERRELASVRGLHAAHLGIAVEAGGDRLAAGTNDVSLILWRDATATVDPKATRGGETIRAVAPNPFAHSVCFSLAVPYDGYYRLTITDVTGHEVGRPLDGRVAAGAWAINWSPGGIPAGVYFYRLTAPDGAKTGMIQHVR